MIKHPHNKQRQSDVVRHAAALGVMRKVKIIALCPVVGVIALAVFAFGFYEGRNQQILISSAGRAVSVTAELLTLEQEGGLDYLIETKNDELNAMLVIFNKFRESKYPNFAFWHSNGASMEDAERYISKASNYRLNNPRSFISNGDRQWYLEMMSKKELDKFEAVKERRLQDELQRAHNQHKQSRRSETTPLL